MTQASDTTAAADKPTIREAWETAHGVIMRFPTKAKPYYRFEWYEKNGKRRYGSGGTDRDEAWAKANEVERRLASSVGDHGKRPCTDLIDAWLGAMRDEWAPLHAQKYEQMVEKYIKPTIGQLPAWSLSRDDIRDLLAKPTSESGRRHLKNAVGSMLVWGYDEQWIPYARDTYIPKKPRTAKREKAGRRHGESSKFIEPALIPDAEHVRLFAEAMRAEAGKGRRKGKDRREEGAWLMTAVAASCGPREGELWALERRHFKLGAQDLTIDQQVIRPKGGGALLTPPKWGRIRDTIIPTTTIWGEPLLVPLTEYLAGLEPNELVFPSKQGGYLHPSNFGRDISVPARRAVEGWKPEWPWHSLRHTFCSWLLSADDATGKVAADVADVCRVAGHRDPSVTMSMYVGSTRGTRDRLRAIAG